MRTTVTLDAEVLRLLRQAMRTRGQGFKQTLNSALLKGLADVQGEIREPPFRVRARRMSLRAGVDPVRLNALADDLELDAYVESTRRLATRRGRK
jgi:2-hydroxychromene-2-carboxylate isomerase